jgi:hypothetical protein
MLFEALDRANRDKQQSQRFIAQQLGYKGSVVLSHMAAGRVPIPVDRAVDFARYLGMDQNEFLLAVLEQRHPDIDFNRLLTKGKAGKATKSDSALLDELEALAGKPLDELPIGQVRVMREVVQDANAPRRWVSRTRSAFSNRSGASVLTASRRQRTRSCLNVWRRSNLGRLQGQWVGVVRLRMRGPYSFGRALRAVHLWLGMNALVAAVGDLRLLTCMRLIISSSRTPCPTS